ncbi:Acyl-CoA:lysophosphatidylglycerol acyltransferase 1 [Gryllus bimaculatus]|nr:Acyl-CoA:lysophosphatidylglycerol acyltransferase 1 [Gryllus bimaculatus]
MEPHAQTQTLMAAQNVREGSLGVACKCVLRTCFVILNNMYCIPTYVVWMVLIFPLRRYRPQLYWAIEGHFFHWLLAMVSMWSWSAGYDNCGYPPPAVNQCLSSPWLAVLRRSASSAAAFAKTNGEEEAQALRAALAASQAPGSTPERGRPASPLASRLRVRHIRLPLVSYNPEICVELVSNVLFRT